MALALPKITYTAIGGSSPSTLSFLHPPRFVAAYNRVATRHDNISTAGVKEVLVERVDNFLEVTLEYVAIGSDVNAWDSFMQNAVQGVQFNYFPDSIQGAYITCTLEDTTWKAEYKQLGQYTFKLLFRAVIT